MKNDRLFQIVNLLINRKSITAPELANELDVSVRTIYRDIETLSLSGVPVYTTAGKNGGIQIMEGYKLDKTVLTDEEQEQLLQSIQNMQMFGNGSNELRTKLSALFHKEIKPWIAVDFTRWGGEEGEDTAKFELIKQAILKKQVLVIQYYGTYPKEREICPIQMLYKSKDWYVYTYCRYRNDYRTFKLNRILSIEEKNEFFNDDKNTLWKADKQTLTKNTVHIRLLFSSKVGYKVFDDFAVETVQMQDDGDFLVETDVPDGDWIYSYLLSYGDAVEVIEPMNVIQGLREVAKSVYEKYL